MRRLKKLMGEEEQERRRQEEQKHLQDIENQTLRWAKAAKLRAYIAEIEKMAGQNNLPAEQNERSPNWLRWAREHADRIDPLVPELVWMHRK